MRAARRLSTATRAARLDRAWAALAAASVAASGLALGARHWWFAELFTHFRVQLVAAQAVLIVGLLVARRARLAVVVTAFACANAWFVYPALRAIDTATANLQANLSVMTVNVQANNTNGASLIDIIERELPDVLLVVEFTARWGESLEPLRARYPHRLIAPDHGNFGLALLSRYPLTAAAEFRLETTPAIEAEVAGPAGAFTLIGVHLRPPTSAARAAERNRQLEALAARARRVPGPLIVAGDFNLSPYSPYYEDMLGASGLTDSLAGHGLAVTWPTQLPLLGIPIDHCLVNDHFRVVSRRQLSSFGSDHYPVIVELRQDPKE